jgi:hypothetical protein
VLRIAHAASVRTAHLRAPLKLHPGNLKVAAAALGRRSRACARAFGLRLAHEAARVVAASTGARLEPRAPRVVRRRPQRAVVEARRSCTLREGVSDAREFQCREVRLRPCTRSARLQSGAWRPTEPSA